MRDWVDLLLRGILFDLEHNGFWLADWGPRPGSLGDARRVAASQVAAPRLVSVRKHRMMPADPHLPGNPGFSVHQPADPGRGVPGSRPGVLRVPGRVTGRVGAATPGALSGSTRGRRVPLGGWHGRADVRLEAPGAASWFRTHGGRQSLSLNGLAVWPGPTKVVVFEVEPCCVRVPMLGAWSVLPVMPGLCDLIG